MHAPRKSLISAAVEKGKKAKRRTPLSARTSPPLNDAPRIEEVLLALERALLAQRFWERPHQIPLAGLGPGEQELLLGILGEGTAIVEAPGKGAQTAMATMLSGVWFTSKRLGAEEISHAIDVGVVPGFAFEQTAALRAVSPSPSIESVSASAILRELVEKEEAWEREGIPREINLELHPLLPPDYEKLSAFLGPAPVVLWLEGHCRWWIFATQWRDIWRVEVRTPAGKKAASLLEIGRYPAAIAFPSSAFAVGARRVRRLLQLYGE